MLSGIPAIVMVWVNPIAINYAMFANPSAMNAVKPTQIRSWWYVEIARIDPAHRNPDPPHASMLVLNESSRQLFSSLTLSIRLSQ